MSFGQIMRGQSGREIKDANLPDLLTLFKKTYLPVRNVFHSRAQFFNMKQDDHETLDEYIGKDWWILKENANLTTSQQKKSSHINSRPPSKTEKPETNS